MQGSVSCVHVAARFSIVKKRRPPFNAAPAPPSPACMHAWPLQVWTTEEQMNKDFAASTAIAVDFQGEIVKATQKRAEIKQERAKQNEADLVQLKQAANNPYVTLYLVLHGHRTLPARMDTLVTRRKSGLCAQFDRRGIHGIGCP